MKKKKNAISCTLQTNDDDDQCHCGREKKKLFEKDEENKGKNCANKKQVLATNTQSDRNTHKFKLVVSIYDVHANV